MKGRSGAVMATGCGSDAGAEPFLHSWQPKPILLTLELFGISSLTNPGGDEAPQ